MYTVHNVEIFIKSTNKCAAVLTSVISCVFQVLKTVADQNFASKSAIVYEVTSQCHAKLATTTTMVGKKGRRQIIHFLSPLNAFFSYFREIAENYILIITQESKAL